MTYKFRFTGVSFLLLLNCLFGGCNYETKEILDKTNNLLPNGKHLEVEKNTKLTTSIGVFSKHNYGTSQRVTYKLSINPGAIYWGDRSGEPKNILFYNDTAYIHYLKEKSIRVEYKDTIDQTVKTDYHSEIQNVFEKHIDERYFFNFFGRAYWVNISNEDYFFVKKLSEEYPIPNDNELSIKVIDDN